MTDEGHLDRAGDRQTEDSGLLDEGFSTWIPSGKWVFSFLLSLGEVPSGLGCLGRRSTCSREPGGSLRCLRTRGGAGHLESPKHQSPGPSTAEVGGHSYFSPSASEQSMVRAATFDLEPYSGV